MKRSVRESSIMKSYLSLIPISVKVRRRQNRMTLLCIIFAVFLVTAIFGMADMLVRMESTRTKEVHGNWHIQLKNISKDEAGQIAARPDVAAASWYDVVNLDMDREYFIDGKQAALCGIEEDFRTEIMSYFTGDFSPLGEDGVILTPDARGLLGVDVGGSITLDTPAGRYPLRVIGFRSSDLKYEDSNTGETTALLMQEGQVGVFMDIALLNRILAENQDKGSPVYYIQFRAHADIKKAVAEIRAQYGLTDGDVAQNTLVMAMMGLSDNPTLRNLYPVVAVLFLLILLAGVLMISGSLNSTIAQRSQFFGMMRCIGMSRQQIIRFVRMEALNWCKTAIPAGVVLGTIASWAACAVMRYGVGGEFADMPVFGVSVVGVLSGALLGILTVILAAQSPAKRAAKVSPAAAVSGSLDSVQRIRHRTKAGLLNIETTLGISHAVSAKKNLFLMAGSFALSIILFLCFSVMVQLLNYMFPVKSYAPDLSIQSSEYTNTIDHTLVSKIAGMPGVKRAFGRMSTTAIPAKFSVEAEQTTVDLISYDDFELDCLLKDDELRPGSDLSGVYGDNGQVLVIWDQNVSLGIGDWIELCGFEVEISGIMKYNPFSNNGGTDGDIILICSEQTFTRLTGDEDFAIIDIQMEKDAGDAEMRAIRDLVKGTDTFRDRREEGDRSLYWAFGLFIYGFLIIIALITMLNIVNSISMSVSARTKQYGAMRAVGMDGQQLTRMIAMEAATYAFVGCVSGCIIGLPLNRLMYEKLIAAHFPYYPWSLPVRSLLIILLFVLAATVASVHAPSKRIRNLAVTETLNEL